jgi:hypothetical protein
MTHNDAVRLTLLTLSELGCLVARREVGLFFDLRGIERRIGINGEADVQGLVPGGRALAVEVKAGRCAKRSKDQIRWGARFVQLGGLYVVARFTATEDGRETIRRAVQMSRPSRDRPACMIWRVLDSVDNSVDASVGVPVMPL